MAALLEFEVGPFCGNPQSGSIRVWGGVKKEHISATSKGVVRWKTARQTDFPSDQTLTFKISRELDGTGIVDIGGLKPDTTYSFQAYYYLESDSQEPNWPASNSTMCSAKTCAEEANAAGTSFLLGSCRDHAPPGSGGLSDKTFRTIDKAINDGKFPVPDFMFMAGDQVYADLSGHRFQDVYRYQFSEQYYKKVRSKIPAYMQMDDHEIENDWSRSNIKEGLWTEGLRFFKAYQAAVGPVYERAEDYENDVSEYWYEFESHDSRFFVMDVRNERYIVNKDADQFEWELKNDDITEQQVDRLICWIGNAPSDRMNFIVTPVPMFPDTKPSWRQFLPPWLYSATKASKKELWTSNTKQRNEILAAIKCATANFIFLSGDVHCSFATQMNLGAGKKVYSVVSSALNWMYPGLYKRCFDFTELRGFAGSRGELSLLNDGHVETRNNYAHIEVEGPSSVLVKFYDGHNGKLIKSALPLKFAD